MDKELIIKGRTIFGPSFYSFIFPLLNLRSDRINHAIIAKDII